MNQHASGETVELSGPVDSIWLFWFLRRVLAATGAVVCLYPHWVFVGWPQGFKRGAILVKAEPADDGRAFTISIRIDPKEPVHVLDLDKPSLREVDRKEMPKWMTVEGADPVTLPWDMEMLAVNTIMKIAWLVEYTTGERIPNLKEAYEEQKHA